MIGRVLFGIIIVAIVALRAWEILASRKAYVAVHGHARGFLRSYFRAGASQDFGPLRKWSNLWLIGGLAAMMALLFFVKSWYLRVPVLAIPVVGYLLLDEVETRRRRRVFSGRTELAEDAFRTAHYSGLTAEQWRSVWYVYQVAADDFQLDAGRLRPQDRFKRELVDATGQGAAALMDKLYSRLRAGFKEAAREQGIKVESLDDAARAFAAWREEKHPPKPSTQHVG